MKKVVISTLVGFASLATVANAASVGADPKTATFEVRITINESCKFTSAQDITFAAIDRSTLTDSTATGQLNITCTLNTPYKIALAGKDQMSSANTGSSSKIAYELFQDSSNTTAWAVDKFLSRTGTGKDQAIPVYAKLKGNNTNVEAGTYSDTVVASVTY